MRHDNRQHTTNLEPDSPWLDDSVERDNLWLARVLCGAHHLGKIARTGQRFDRNSDPGRASAEAGNPFTVAAFTTTANCEG